MSDKSLSDSWPHSIEILFTDHMILYYTKGLCHPLSDICNSSGRRRKGKGLVVLCRYNNYYEPTKDPAFCFIIMLLPWPLNSTRCLYETDHNSWQHGI